MKEQRSNKIPPSGLVRLFASFILLADIAIIGIIGSSVPNVHWTAYVVLAGEVGSLYCVYKALKTGDPEWILLDLLIR